jgi:hypothetical protein
VSLSYWTCFAAVVHNSDAALLGRFADGSALWANLKRVRYDHIVATEYVLPIYFRAHFGRLIHVGADSIQ